MIKVPNEKYLEMKRRKNFILRELFGHQYVLQDIYGGYRMYNGIRYKPMISKREKCLICKHIKEEDLE
jgi:hypothetical protein